MPVIDVVDELGRLLPDANIKIWATMLVPAGPEDEHWHLHVDAQRAEAALSSGADGVALDRAAFNRLYGAGRGFVEAEQTRRARDGGHVGEVFLILRTLDRFRPEIASRHRAMLAHANDMREFEKLTLLRAESKLRAAWSEFEIVAPLWAAHRLLCRSKEFGIGAAIDWQLLLALADQYRRWAENHHSPMGRMGNGRATEPTLQPSAAWRVPAHAILPHDEASRLDRLKPGRRFDELIKKQPA